jgi:hypothetical protein
MLLSFGSFRRFLNVNVLWILVGDYLHPDPLQGCQSTDAKPSIGQHGPQYSDPLGSHSLIGMYHIIAKAASYGCGRVSCSLVFRLLDGNVLFVAH